MASDLVRRGLLTSWQSRRLLKGHSTFFLGRYRLLDILGRGGMGIVFKAEHASMRRQVAIKVMSSRLLDDPVSVSRFYREIQAVAALDHPNIVRAFDADEAGGTHFLVTEYVPGLSLSVLRKRIGRLPVGVACEFIRQAAQGLQHAHQQGMVHRDIKPGNLLVTIPADGSSSDIGTIRILDLGLARFTAESPDRAELTSTDQIMGTPDYMSPQQARKTKQADIRSDIYSLGCTLFLLLTGRLPFEGETVMDRLVARMTDEPPEIQTLCDDIPPGLADVVSRMLAREVDDRFQIPTEVAAAPRPFASFPSDLDQLLRADGTYATAAGRDGLLVDADSEMEEFLNTLSHLAHTFVDGGLTASAATADVTKTAATTLDTGGQHHRPVARWWKSLLAGMLVMLIAAAAFVLSRPPRAPAPIDDPPMPAASDETQRQRSLEELVQLTDEVRNGTLNAQAEIVALRDRIGMFVRQWRGTAEESAAVALLSQLPSATDLLMQSDIDPSEFQLAERNANGSLPQLVAVFRTSSYPDDVKEKMPPWDADMSVCFAPDGDSLYAADSGGSLVGWELLRGGEIMRRELAVPIRSLDIDSSGQRLAVSGKSSDSLVRIYDLTNGSSPFLAIEEFLRGQSSGELFESVFSSKGDSLILTGHDPGLMVYSLSQRRSIQHFSGTDDDVVTCGAIASNNRLVALGMTQSGKGCVRIWSTSDGKLQHEIPFADHPPIGCMEFSREDRLLATGGPTGEIRLWNPETAAWIGLCGAGFPNPGHANTSRVLDVKFRPDGTLMASAATDGTVRVWQIDSGFPGKSGFEEYRHTTYQLCPDGGRICEIAWSPDGRHIATANGNGTVYVLRLRTAASSR